MSKQDYLKRQVRAIFMVAILRGEDPNKVAANWVKDGFAVKWAERHPC